MRAIIERRFLFMKIKNILASFALALVAGAGVAAGLKEAKVEKAEATGGYKGSIAVELQLIGSVFIGTKIHQN